MSDSGREWPSEARRTATVVLKQEPGPYDGLPIGKLLSAIHRKDYAEADAICGAWRAESPSTICD